MILPERVFGRSSVKRIDFGLAIGPIVAATWSRSSSTRASLGSLPDRRITNAAMAWPGVASVFPTTAASATAGWLDQRALDLGGGDVVTGDEHHVVDPTEEPVVALVVALGAVAGEVLALEPAPVRLPVSLRITPDAAQHRGPRPGEREVAAAGDRTRARPGRRARRHRCPATGRSRSPASTWWRPGAG